MVMERSKNEIVVVGAVYPGVEFFLDDYFNSLERQTNSEFDLLLVNDGFKGLDSLLEKRSLNWICENVTGSISLNRRILIHKALEMGYRKIIFTDTDDTFEENRVEVLNNMLDKDPVIVNDLDILDIQGNKIIKRYFSKRYSEAEMITKNYLLTGNLMGFSNTAVQSEVFRDIPSLQSGESIAFDWYLWSSVLLLGNNARFTSETSTKYRIYENNTAGLPQLLDEENILKGVEVKRQHYDLMAKLNNEYSALMKEYNWLSKKIEIKPWRQKYIEALKSHAIDNHIWWENIRTPSEVGII